jgi:hypothetical protein
VERLNTRSKVRLTMHVGGAHREETVHADLRRRTVTDVWAGTQQGWHLVLIIESRQKLAISHLYRKSKLKNDPPTTPPEGQKMMDSSAYLAEHLYEVPVLVVPCIEVA